MPGDLTVYKQAELLRARMRGIPARAGLPERAAGVPTLAKVLPHRVPLASLHCEPILARIDDKGRVKLRGALEVVGFVTGALHVARAGHWTVLRQAASCAKPVRNAPRVSGDGRLTVPHPVRCLLGVDVGDQVLVQPVPEAGALCLLNPAAVLLGAPLGLLAGDQQRGASPHGGDRQCERDDR